MYISNGDVAVRDFRCEDIENKVAWINDAQNNRYLHYDIPLEYNKTKEWFLNRNTDNRIDCVIEYKGQAVGLIGILAIDRVNCKAEFYVSMGSTEHKRKGIAFNATVLLLRYAFEQFGLNKIYLNVDKENTPAVKLYEKVGFSLEGVFVKDMLHRGEFIDRARYAIFKDTFLKRYF